MIGNHHLIGVLDVTILIEKYLYAPILIGVWDVELTQWTTGRLGGHLMGRCRGTTAKGHRCRRNSRPYCKLHEHQDKDKSAVAVMMAICENCKTEVIPGDWILIKRGRRTGACPMCGHALVWSINAATN